MKTDDTNSLRGARKRHARSGPTFRYAVPSAALASVMAFLLASGVPVLAEPLHSPLLVRPRANLPIAGCQWVWGEQAAGLAMAYLSCTGAPPTTYAVALDAPDDPQIIGSWVGGGDIEVVDGIAYQCASSAVSATDVSVPWAPELLSTLNLPPGHGCHNLSYDPAARYLYVASLDGTLVYDLSPYDPGSLPGSVDPYLILPDENHDVTGTDSLLFGTTNQVLEFTYSGWPPSLWGDLEPPQGPGFVHTTWPTSDFRFVVAAKEYADVVDRLGAYYWLDAGVPVYGSGGLATNCSDGPPFNCYVQSGLTLIEFDPVAPGPRQSVVRDVFYLPDTAAGSAHKPKVSGDYVYAAFYQAGLQILKIDRNRTEWSLQAHFDTSVEPPGSFSGLYRGAYDVYPYLGRERILVVDNETGLWVLEHTPAELLAAYMAIL